MANAEAVKNDMILSEDDHEFVLPQSHIDREVEELKKDGADAETIIFYIESATGKKLSRAQRLKYLL